MPIADHDPDRRAPDSGPDQTGESYLRKVFTPATVRILIILAAAATGGTGLLSQLSLQDSQASPQVREITEIRNEIAEIKADVKVLMRKADQKDLQQIRADIKNLLMYLKERDRAGGP